MQTKLEELEGLECQINVTIPVEEIRQQYQKQLKDLKNKANLPGFRPGKIPENILLRKFGKELELEVAKETINSTLPKVFEQLDNENKDRKEKIILAGEPKINFDHEKFNLDQPLEYVIQFEKLPNIELKELEGQPVEQLRCEITAQDVENELKEIQESSINWKPVERPAQLDDRLIIDFEGHMDGEEIKKGKAENFELILGKSRMIAGFEEGLIGAISGETRSLNLKFPQDYMDQTVAGKETQFKIVVHEVAEPELPTLDDEFAKKKGFSEGLAEMREKIHDILKHNLEHLLEHKNKQIVLNKLIEINPFAIPKTLLDQEIKYMHSMNRYRLAREYNLDEKQLNQLQFPDEPFIEDATARVKNGLLIAEVIKKNKITIDDKRLRENIEHNATHVEDPQRYIKYVYSNEHALAEAHTAVLEEQAVEKLLEQANIQYKTISYAELSKEN